MAVVSAFALISAPGELLARGGRGGGGGGGRPNMSRPSGGAPSFSRPSGGGMAGGGQRMGGGNRAPISTHPAGGGGGAGPPAGGGAAGNRGFDGNRMTGGAGNINSGNINRGNINSGDINSGNINRGNINSGNINRGNINSGNINRGAVNNDSFVNRNFNGGNATDRNFNNSNITNRNFNNDNFANRNFNNNNFVNRSGNFSNNNINVNHGGQYGGWYHGNWHPNAGWNGGGYRPWGWGWGGGGFGWGLGAGLLTAGVVAAVSPWNWGYYGYSNPYWGGDGGNAYINYSQPIVAAAPLDPNPALLADDGSGPALGPGDIADAGGAPAPATPQDQSMAIFDGARQQFTAGDYAGALAAVDNAIKLQPSDPVLHEFRALCLFAQGDYQQSAAATYAVLSGGPGWDWTTVSSLYPSIMVYTQQLRALEKYTQDHPDAADARFLLAYQYLLNGHNDAASAELKQVVALQPSDTLSAQLLKSISPAADGGAPTPGPGAPTPDAAPALAAKPATAAALVGNWTASRPDGTKVEMGLGPANQFTWQFTQGGKPQELKGTYTLADNYLVLKASEQNSLVGQVGMLAGNQMSFRLADNNPADPGLVFKR
jgi:tetratricopeptide (TPR) repeat protein